MPESNKISRRNMLLLIGGAATGSVSAAGTYLETTNNVETTNYTLNTDADNKVTYSFEEEDDLSMILERSEDTKDSEALITTKKAEKSYEMRLSEGRYNPSDAFSEEVGYLPDFEVTDVDKNDKWTGISIEFDEVLNGKYSRS